MSKLKIGFAGFGFVAGVHEGNLRADDRVEIAAICDIDPARGTTRDFDEMLAASDAVYITAPNTLHYDYAMRAIAAGKHVFCEKPFSVTMEHATSLLAAAEASPKVFQVGFNRRFANVYTRLKELQAEHPAHCAHIKMNRGELLNPAWTGDDAVTGGFLFETPIHMFDLMRFQFGEIGSLTARLSQANDFSCLIEFISGAHATFVTSADASWIFPYERIESFGRYSTIETMEMESIRYCLGLGQTTSEESFVRFQMPGKWGFREGDRLFIDACLAGSKPPVTARDGYESVRLCLACYESARERRTVNFR